MTTLASTILLEGMDFETVSGSNNVFCTLHDPQRCICCDTERHRWRTCRKQLPENLLKKLRPFNSWAYVVESFFIIIGDLRCWAYFTQINFLKNLAVVAIWDRDNIYCKNPGRLYKTWPPCCIYLKIGLRILSGEGRYRSLQKHGLTLHYLTLEPFLLQQWKRP